MRKGYIDTTAGQLHYRMTGFEKDAGAPVVFWHRAPVTSASFRHVFAELAGWRPLVAFDTPGFGESFAPPPDMDFAAFIDVFAEAMAGLGIGRCHLVGHHSGCHFAAGIAARADTKALSLMIDGAMVASAKERIRVTPAAPAPVIDADGGYVRDAWRFVQPYYPVFNQRCVHDEFTGAMQSLFTRGPTMAVVRDHDLGAALAMVRCPVLASAAQDDVFGPHLERIAARLPGAAIRQYGKAGIASPELQAGMFASLVREAAAMGEAPP